MDFNQAMAAELSAGLPPDEIRALFSRIGARVAATMPMERCDTLDALQSGLNARWASIQFGFGTLHDAGEAVRIAHDCSPLAVAFGPAASDWAGGFFEGAYQAWFAQQGMPGALRVRALPAEPGTRQVRLQLSRGTA